MERDPVRPITNPRRPTSDFARSEIRPLETSERVALFSRQVLRVDFG